MQEIYFHKNANVATNIENEDAKLKEKNRLNLKKSKGFSTISFFHSPLTVAAYLLCDCTSTLDELPLGEAVSGAELQGSSLLDQVDTAMAQFLHPRLYLEPNLKP